MTNRQRPRRDRPGVAAMSEVRADMASTLAADRPDDLEPRFSGGSPEPFTPLTEQQIAEVEQRGRDRRRREPGKQSRRWPWRRLLPLTGAGIGNGRTKFRNGAMVDYAIVPRNRGYWIEAIEKDGSRRLIERYETEASAVQRLRVLHEKAGLTKPRHDPIPR
jgi:hypothetical protein